LPANILRQTTSRARRPPWATAVRRLAVVAVVSALTALGAAALLPGSARGSVGTGAPFTPPVQGSGLLAFTSSRTGTRQIFAMNPDGSGQTNLSNDPGFDDFGAAWSPDGTKIAFVSTRAGNQDVWVMNADGSGQLDVTNDPGSDSDPAWSPDGSQIAFASDRTGDFEIWTMSADGSNTAQFTSDPATDRNPAWSPDGDALLWTSNRTGDDEIFEQSSKGTGVPMDLSNDPGHADDRPAWSPDGATIAFDSDRSGKTDVFVMNADGSAQTDITTATRGSSIAPEFSPDEGARVAYELVRLAGGQIGLSNVTPSKTTYGPPALVSADPASATEPSWQPLPAGPANGSPIQHVVILFQENHSFDNVLGELCQEDVRCDGATVGFLHTGEQIPLGQATDIVPNVLHSPKAQQAAVNAGQMNGFDLVKGCGAPGYKCYTQFSPSQIPNLAALVRSFAVSDRTFESDLVASWTSHLQLATAITDGFVGNNPSTSDATGWGCDSLKDTQWKASAFAKATMQPSCIPFIDGTGPHRATPVPWVPTIMDRLDEAGLSWKLYTAPVGVAGYGWAICPTFSECIYGGQQSNVLTSDQFVNEAAAGTLPAVSLVMPTGDNSQHNFNSMLQGDNWIGQVANAVMTGPEWSSTAMFLTWDDCGCFYDHVPPPGALGIRVPMVMISPYAKAAFTDSTNASFASMLAYIEHTFGLAPLSTEDSNAYDFSDSFDYSQRRIAPIRMQSHAVPRWEQRWIRGHPADPDDPT
jgi:TolB protein